MIELFSKSYRVRFCQISGSLTHVNHPLCGAKSSLASATGLLRATKTHNTYTLAELRMLQRKVVMKACKRVQATYLFGAIFLALIQNHGAMLASMESQQRHGEEEGFSTRSEGRSSSCTKWTCTAAGALSPCNQMSRSENSSEKEAAADSTWEVIATTIWKWAHIATACSALP